VRRGHAAKKVLRTGAPLLLLLGEPGDGSRGYGADLACRGPGPDDDVYERLLAFGDEELRNYKSRLTLRSFEPTVAHEIAHLMSLISPKPLRMVLTEQDIQYASQIEAFDAALEPKSLIVLPGHHYALYAQGKGRDTIGLGKAVHAARTWFVEHLA
jgi:hypothetical protein